MVYTVDTVYTIQTALHCLKSSWADRTDVSEIANMGYVVDRAEGADWADGAEMALRMNTLSFLTAWEFKNIAYNGL